MGAGKPAFMSCVLRLALLEPQEDVPPGCNPPQRGLVYRLAPKAPLLGEY